MLPLKTGAAVKDGTEKSGSAAWQDSFGLYVHWPFCLSKCPYCDFNSHVRDTVDHDQWRRALVRELDYYAQATNHLTLSSIFFGGGTPSLMAPDTVEAVINAAVKNWKVADDIEITLEANPTSIEREKFRAFRDAGINRVSVGVQSLRDEDLKALGREHSAAEALSALETARTTFDRYSFDLIYARQGQSLGEWEKELGDALKQAGHHVSLYQLTIEPGTAFHTRFQRGDLTLPQDDEAAVFYDLTQDMMAAAGLPAYETSNHARPGEESRHNLTYWHYGQYAGIGPGAHGRIVMGGARYATRAHRAPERWLERVAENGHGAHPFEALDSRAQAEEALLMGLRLNEGLEKSRFQAGMGIDFEEMVDRPQLDMLVKEGFLRETQERLAVTRKGMLCLNSVLGRIIS